MKNDVLTRALKTFWQAAIAYLVAAFSTQMAGVDVFDLESIGGILGGLLMGALAAGISAAWNGVVQPKLTKGGGADA